MSGPIPWRALARTIVGVAFAFCASGTRAASPPPPLDEWTVKTALDGSLQNIGSRAIAVDSTGQAWIAYGGDVLRVAHGGPSGFTVEVVDPNPGSGAYANVRVDSTGAVHVAYVDRVKAKVLYAKRSGSNWTTESVATYGPETCTVSSSTPVSMELDASGGPRIAYYDRQNTAVTLATRRPDGTWPSEVIDPDGGGEVSIAIDASGRTHACYGRGGGIWHAAKSAGGWDREVIQAQTLGDAFSSVGGSPNLVVDSKGHLHAFYVDGGFFGCCSHAGVYATNASGKWVTNLSGAYRTYVASLAISPQDDLYFSSYGISGDFQYASIRGDGTSSSDTIFSSEFLDSAVASGPDGTPQLVGIPQTPGPLVHMKRNPDKATFTRTNVGEAGTPRSAASLFYDAAGRVCLTTTVPGEFGRLEGVSWVRSSYAADAERPGIVVPGVGADVLAAYARTVTTKSHEIRLASLASGAWTSRSLATLTGLAGQADALAVLARPSGDVVVVAQSAPDTDNDYGELHALTVHDGSVTDELIDLGIHYVGFNPGNYFANVAALEGPDGRVHLLYRHVAAVDNETFTTQVRHAVRGPSGWTVEVVETTRTYVSDLEAAYAPSGDLHATYYTTEYSDSGEVRHLRRSGSTWSSEVVGASAPNTGNYGASMVLVGETVHVAYVDTSAKRRIVESERGPGGSADRVVDASGNANRFRLVADATGRLHVAFSRYDLGEMWYGVLAPGDSWRTTSIDDGGIGNPTFRAETLRPAQGATSVVLPIGLARLDGVGQFGKPAIAVDAVGTPHVATTLAALNDIRFATPGRPQGAQLGTVDYTTVDGDGADGARAGEDYVARSGTFTWALGDGGGRTLEVPLLQDPDHVGDLTFKVRLQNSTGFNRAGACPELAVTVRNVPAGAVVAYFLPTSVAFRPNAKTPAKGKFKAAGFFDLGLASGDLSGATYLTIGSQFLSMPSLTRSRSGSYAFKSANVVFTLTPDRSGSSRAKFKITYTGDLTGKVNADGPLTLRFVKSGIVDGTGTVGLQKGGYKLGRIRGALTAPSVFPYAVKGGVKGGGKDTITLKAGIGSLGTAPATAPDVTVSVGTKFSVTIPGSQLTRGKGESFVGKAPAHGLKSFVLAYDKETLALSATGVDLGTLPSGPQSVVVKVDVGGVARLVLVRMVRSGSTLKY